jgi:VIT1/CCC1 family predicted Fe2+/Mn2+ transporter
VYDPDVAPIDIAQSLENLKLERDAIQLYDQLATIERDARRSEAFRTIAATERRHADIWARRLEELGATVPPPSANPRARVRAIIVLARLFGTHAVSSLVQALEGDESGIYESQGSPEVASIAADEEANAEIWRQLSRERQTATAKAVIRVAAKDGNGAHGPVEMPITAPADVAARERWHRSGRSGTLRAIIFGVSDGLVSNLSLVMGVAGASSNDPKFILLAGIAGLLAGAFSMAAGEYISMQSQRELFEHQIALERAELQMMPELEEQELVAIYRSKGFTDDEARTVAHRLSADPEMALDTLVREELGLDPEELGSPWGAAGGSFAAFAIGAAVPVVPFLFGGGPLVFGLSIGLSLLALFAVGAGVSLVTGRGTLFSGIRQVLIGSAAAAVTYAVGLLIGVSVAG